MFSPKALREPQQQQRRGEPPPRSPKTPPGSPKTHPHPGSPPQGAPQNPLDLLTAPPTPHRVLRHTFTDPQHPPAPPNPSQTLKTPQRPPPHPHLPLRDPAKSSPGPPPPVQPLIPSSSGLSPSCNVSRARRKYPAVSGSSPDPGPIVFRPPRFTPMAEAEEKGRLNPSMHRAGERNYQV